MKERLFLCYSLLGAWLIKLMFVSSLNISHSIFRHPILSHNVSFNRYDDFIENKIKIRILLPTLNRRGVCAVQHTIYNS